MADRLCDEILAGKYADDDRIPSVREYAVMLQVNTNTAVKAYDQLARDGIIYNKRGLGYFVTPGAAREIKKSRKKEFMTTYDDTGSIGKRYRRSDAIGTPYAITIDDDTVNNGTVTIRDRDTMEQVKMSIDEVISYVNEKIKF